MSEAQETGSHTLKRTLGPGSLVALGIGARVLEAIDGLRVLAEHPVGGAAIDATGAALPDATLAACRDADAVLLGAVGGPKWDDPKAKVRPEQGLLALRKGLGLYANLRPVAVNATLAGASTLQPGRPGGRRHDRGARADRRHLLRRERSARPTAPSTPACTRSARSSASCAWLRSWRAAARRSCVSVDKANVLETSRLWREVTVRVMAERVPGRRAATHAGRRVRDAPDPRARATSTSSSPRTCSATS